MGTIVQGEVSIYLYHVASEKYIGTYEASSNGTMYLIPDMDNAQLFTIILNEVGFFQLKASNFEDKVMDKNGGCGYKDPVVRFYEAHGRTNQLFSFNNDNTIGSRCCKTCLLSSNEDDTFVVMKKKCLGRSVDEKYIFEIIPKINSNDEIC